METNKTLIFFTKGLRKIVENELQEKFPRCNIIQTHETLLIADINTSLDKLASLKSVDDVCLFLFDNKDVKNVDEIVEKFEIIDLAACSKTIARIRDIQKNQFSITASTSGTDFKSEEIKEKLSKFVSEKYSWLYTPEDHSNFDIRISSDKTSTFAGIRIFTKSLHHRAYKQFSQIGSLKPSIAYAMVAKTLGQGRGAGNLKRKLKIVDNFCGSGTILAEALLEGCEVFGGDIDKNAVGITINNLKNLNFSDYLVRKLDAKNSKWPDFYFDAAISNLPWGDQIKVDKIYDLYKASIIEYKRILKPGSPICLLAKGAEFVVSQIKEQFGYRNIEVIKLGYLGQQPSLVVGRGK